jgi:hypothetical protein
MMRERVMVGRVCRLRREIEREVLGDARRVDREGREDSIA